MKALVGRNGHLMRRLVGEVVRSADDKRLTESQLLEMLGLESIQSLIRKRKLQWVAHCARRGDKDLSWKRIVREVEDGKSKWGTRLKEDWKELGVKSTRGWCNKVKDKGWLASKLGKSKKKGKGKKATAGAASHARLSSCRESIINALIIQHNQQSHGAAAAATGSKSTTPKRIVLEFCTSVDSELCRMQYARHPHDRLHRLTI